MAKLPEYHDESFEHPNRVKVRVVDARNGIYDIERMCGKGREGTPLNKKFIDSYTEWVQDISLGKIPLGRGLRWDNSKSTIEISTPLSVSLGGTGASNRQKALETLGITVSRSKAPSTGDPYSIHIQIL